MEKTQDTVQIQESVVRTHNSQMKMIWAKRSVTSSEAWLKKALARMVTPTDWPLTCRIRLREEVLTRTCSKYSRETNFSKEQKSLKLLCLRKFQSSGEETPPHWVTHGDNFYADNKAADRVEDIISPVDQPIHKVSCEVDNEADVGMVALYSKVDDTPCQKPGKRMFFCV